MCLQCSGALVHRFAHLQILNSLFSVKHGQNGIPASDLFGVPYCYWQAWAFSMAESRILRFEAAQLARKTADALVRFGLGAINYLSLNPIE